ncbi:hypothetical protein L1887_48767 [Cichorium endivia]|nr:hypothetical protein L1887_48767 [Cichorium endivia]
MSDERFDVRSEWNEVVDGELEVTGGALAKGPWSGSRAISAEACLAPPRSRSTAARPEIHPPDALPTLGSSGSNASASTYLTLKVPFALTAHAETAQRWERNVTGLIGAARAGSAAPKVEVLDPKKVAATEPAEDRHPDRLARDSDQSRDPPSSFRGQRSGNGNGNGKLQPAFILQHPSRPAFSTPSSLDPEAITCSVLGQRTPHLSSAQQQERQGPISAHCDPARLKVQAKHCRPRAYPSNRHAAVKQFGHHGRTGHPPNRGISSVSAKNHLVLISFAARLQLLAANLVLQDTVERVFVGNRYGDIARGVFLVRGENVVLMGEIDLDAEDEVPPSIAAPLPPSALPQLLAAKEAEAESKAKSEAKKADVLRIARGFCADKSGDGDTY